MKGWFNILSYPGTVTALESAFLAVEIPLYLHPCLSYHEENPAHSSQQQGDQHLLIKLQYFFHFLSTPSYQGVVVSLQERQMMSITSSGSS